ncbi:MAG: putative quinol monooxygenase [Xanthobacteraceae bacterium]
MLKSTTIISAALLSVTALLLLPLRGHEAAAQSAPLLVNVIEYDIVPGQVDHYLAAAKENAAAAVKEPGCHAFDILVSEKDPNHVLLVEAYDNAAAVEAHRETAHFKKYAGIIKEMIAKREARPFSSVAMNAKGM